VRQPLYHVMSLLEPFLRPDKEGQLFQKPLPSYYIPAHSRSGHV
jgi:hypothetical protein